MANKIIHLTKAEYDKCLICCDNEATVKMSINRPKYNDNIILFNVCDKCLAQMQKDIETHE
jgi:hypothetical protein